MARDVAVQDAPLGVNCHWFNGRS